jgi:hypothetical protein
MAGSVSGLQTKMREVEPKALFVHCNGHNLNLVVQDAVSTISQYRDAINMLGTLINFVRDSPKRLRFFEHLQQPSAKSLKPYCPTRWVLRESAFKSVKENYEQLWEFFQQTSESDKSDAGAKAAGFATQLSSFQTYFYLASLNKLFSLVREVSQAIQALTLHLYEANKM